jgi:Zn finger protein HypA/HybF involved in hydrogenase expression
MLAPEKLGRGVHICSESRMAEKKFLNTRCPHCKVRTDLTYAIPLFKGVAYRLKRWFGGGKTKGVQSARLVTTVAHGKELQCLSCRRIVLQCSSCKKIIPYVNRGNCPECGALIS